MPIYLFNCESCKTNFEEFCSYEQSFTIKCPECSQDVVRMLTAPNLSFVDPRSTSKWDSFEYRAGWNMEKAKAERRAAEEKSHVGSNPYQDSERIDLEKHDADLYDGKIV